MLNKNWYGFKIDYWERIPEAFKANERRSMNILFHFKWLTTTAQKCQISFLHPQRKKKKKKKKTNHLVDFSNPLSLAFHTTSCRLRLILLIFAKNYTQTLFIVVAEAARNVRLINWTEISCKYPDEFDENQKYIERESNFLPHLFVWFFFILRSCFDYIFKRCLHVYVGFGYLLWECVYVCVWRQIIWATTAKNDEVRCKQEYISRVCTMESELMM